MRILKPHEKLTNLDFVLFDFDGTISKLRNSWDIIMRDLMVEMIPGDREEVRELAEKYIDESCGIPTICQMQFLADKVKERTGSSLEARQYKQMWSERMMIKLNERKEEIRKGIRPASYYTVSGAADFIKAFKSKNIPVYLASGSDEDEVRSDAEALGVLDLFDDICGASPNSSECAKQKMLRKYVAPGKQMLVIGDGKTEIEHGCSLGAVTIGVASWDYFGDLPEDLNPQKEARLVEAGAHMLVSDYRDFKSILEWI